MLKAVLIGNLGSDPDLRYSPEGRAFLRMNVACNSRVRSPEGEWQDHTEWVRVTVFGQQAERLSQYLRKGSKVYVDGRLEARPWTDQQHQVRAGLEVIASDVQFMSPRAEGEAAQELGRQTVAATAGAEPNAGAGQARDLDAELEDLPF